MDKMFIVFCQHNTGHGPTADIILLTSDLMQAINTAKDAGSLGFEFLSSESFIAVIAAEPNHAYTKKELKLNSASGSSKDYPGVYLHYFDNGKWKKRWLNDIYGIQYDIQRGIFESDHGEIKVGTPVSFMVENQSTWGGDLQGVLIIEENDFKIETKRSGVLTINKKLDVYGNTIKPIRVAESV